MQTDTIIGVVRRLNAVYRCFWESLNDMTIAACYLSSEGVVLGADSTSTMFIPGPGSQSGAHHHYDFAQKIFEIGEDSTAGVAMWGLGSIGEVSYRTIVADVADSATLAGISDIESLARVFASLFWSRYCTEFDKVLPHVRDLASKAVRTTEEMDQLQWYSGLLSGGFCFGGRWGSSRQPCAFELTFAPTMTEAPTPQPISSGSTRFWGCPNLISRVLYGIDDQLFSAILGSGKWKGDGKDLFGLVSESMLTQPRDLPLREAIDWVYASIYTTIKGMKFSHLAPVCGGPIEIAVITSDRPFRWVRHKQLDAAIE
ncbi:MAG: hypothetical protein AABZ47_09380 [Planctomycetota bacterium]